MIVARRVAVFVAVASAVTAPASVQGAIRHAGPAGAGIGCTVLAPCDLGTAVNGATSGDEIVVAAGSYTGYPNLAAAGKALNIHGAAGQPRPVLTTATSTLTVGAGSTVRRLEITASAPTTGALITMVGTGAGNVDQPSVIVDDVIARSPGALIDIANAGAGNRIRSSILIGAGGGVAVSIRDTTQTTIEHVTLLAQGGQSTALRVDAASAPSMRVAVSNSIVRGGDQDVAATEGGADTLSVTLENSAYRTARVGALVTNGANNILGDPVFVDAATGDFHQAPGSPTIDAGTATSVLTDIDGQPRSIGPQPDIGADEVGARATLATDPVTAITTTGATLNGIVNPNGLATTYRFDYGPTTSYGTTTAAVALGADASGHPVQTVISGLTPSTRYHVRVVATNSLGLAFGDDVTFTTLADTVAPTIGPVSATPKSPRRGTPVALRFRLSEAAGVTVTIDRIGSGRKRGTRCDARATAGPRCATFTRVATVRRQLAAGNPVRFVVPARPGGKALSRGTYRLTVQATDVSRNASRTRNVTLIVR